MVQFLTMDFTNAILGGIFLAFGVPFLLLCAAVAGFSYFVSKGQIPRGIVAAIFGVLITLVYLYILFIFL